MKTYMEHDNTVTLVAPTTGDNDFKELNFPLVNIHHWYPFNVNFTYKYSNSKKHLYLVKGNEYEGENLYNTASLKQSRPLPIIDGVPDHAHVHKRNAELMEYAQSLGIPVMSGQYSMDDVQRGFKELDNLIKLLKSSIESRLIEELEERVYEVHKATEAWDKAVYEVATKEELDVLERFGEIYTMLSLMRKIKEVE
jgi:hypothetical protein